jgi:peroxiredoxin (alkyl hydroperoxide reductase subunit C)
MQHREEGVECADWFFCTRKLAAEDVEKAIRTS